MVSNARTLRSPWARHHLRGAQHLAKALVLAEVEGLASAVIEVRKDHRPAIGKAELVAAEGRNAAGRRRRRMIEVVARVEGRVAHKLKDTIRESRCCPSA